MMPTLPAENIIAEPRPAGTAAALSWAAAEIARRDGDAAVMISVHADWAIGDAEAFRAALRRAAEVARKHAALVTIGIVPHRPDTGFGYIRPGDVADGDARRVQQFVEKPDRLRAEAMVRDGCLWNSGIFVWRVGDFLDDVRRLTPEVAPALAVAGDNLQTFFATVQNIAVDVGVLERSDRVIVMPGEFDWDDVGTWAALRRVRALDAQGNASLGHVHAIESSGNVAHAEAGDIVLFGVENLVVVQREGLTLVTTMDRAADLKRLVEALPASVRDRA
jgi:mannose-1-phosphate guanylyltransferase